MDPHIVKAFDEELRHLDDKIAEMGGRAEAQLADAVAALVKRDPRRAAILIERDREIDSLEHEINLRAVRLLALRQPVADDLRTAVAALKISHELERIGDHAKNIAKRIAGVTDAPPVASLHTLVRMAGLVEGMIKSVLDAYLRRDARKAEDVRDQDVTIDQLHSSLFREILTYMMEDPRKIGTCTHLLFIAKNIERIGDQATNIAESVLFCVRGETPPTDRPRDDQSSVTVLMPVRRVGPKRRRLET